MKKKSFFFKFVEKISIWSGSATAFSLAFISVVVWASTGPIFGYSDTWQMVINTGTTIITFLLVFVIQNSQNRDTKALQIKLDELIRVTEGAHTALLDLESLTDEELIKIHEKYDLLAKESRKLLREGKEDIHVPEVRFEG